MIGNRILHSSGPSHRISDVQFRLYSIEEVLRLSVLEVTNLETFDALLHPTPAGLYDSRLGAVEFGSFCGTCNQTELHCPGHLGHISLPLVVINPFMFKLVFQFTKGSCLNCQRLLCNSQSLPVKILLAQLKCLEAGYLAAVDEVCEVAASACGSKTVAELDTVAELPEKSSRRGMQPSVLRQQDSMQVDEAIEAYMTQLFNGQPPASGCVRSVVDRKSALIKDFAKNHLFKRPAKCPHCKQKLDPVRQEYNRTILVGSQSVATSAKGAVKADMSLDVEDDSLLMPDEQLEQFSVGDLESELNQGPQTRAQVKCETRSPGWKSGRPVEKTETLEDSLYLNAHSPNKRGSHGRVKLLSPQTLKDHLRLVWTHDGALLAKLFPLLDVMNQRTDGKIVDAAWPTDLLFISELLVPSPKFRPPLRRGEAKYENPQTAQLSRILREGQLAVDIMHIMQQISSGQTPDKAWSEEVASKVPGKTWEHRLQMCWIRLQSRVNTLYDSDLDKISREPAQGIKQVLERKEGLFRKHMMGKRVNFAARSVISPDPFIEVDEIGVPEVFATKLSFAESVNEFNVSYLRQLVRNGPKRHPGANFVITEDGMQVLLNAGDNAQREARAKQLFNADRNSLKCPKKVVRHLRDGDILLVNRQPTLHKPSIMAHRAKILHGEKTLRLNYAACKTYNADFDGDEMNLHFAQSEVSRSEGYNLASVSYQYLAPKDGVPLSGLIQDHVISGVLLTMRDRFFTKEDYFHLVFNALGPSRLDGIRLLPPTLLKPVRRWTGKQVVSTVLLNLIPAGKPALNLEGKSKVAEPNWRAGLKKGDVSGTALKLNMHESKVIFRGGELLCGVLDKAHFGTTSYSLVHCCYELYGPRMATELLSSLSRLFTTFLQMHGFTLGVEDILVSHRANKARRRIIQDIRSSGPGVVKGMFHLDDESPADVVTRALAGVYADKDSSLVKELDYHMKSKLDTLNNNINKKCIPNGLLKVFPKNSLQLMIESGSKGTTVNALQISCLLGQIELEGCRMPLMASGRTLPSFVPYDPSPRAGGFVEQRYLTGLKPQEYFFHCMAGREGLIDTACKTSRSGYLQRCIIKHLEGLVVNYDLTVRDSDGSVVQFQYGEDGLEVGKAQFLKDSQLSFLLNNFTAVRPDEERWSALRKAGCDVNVNDFERLHGKIERWNTRQTNKRSPFLAFCDMMCDSTFSKEQLIEQWRDLDPSRKRKLRKMYGTSCPLPLNSRFRPDRVLGAVPENLMTAVLRYANKFSMQDALHCSADEFKAAFFWKTMRAMVEPGEPVGLLAAQSIGEPSTQMTLNTFHFAGRGEMNVTLGIPRLREILMVASRNIATPQAMCPFREGITDEVAEAIRQQLDRVFLKNVLKRIHVEEKMTLLRGLDRSRHYVVRLELLKRSLRKPEARHVSCAAIMREIERLFLRRVNDQIRRKYEELCAEKVVNKRTLAGQNKSANDDATATPSAEMDVEDDVSPAADEAESSDDEGKPDMTDADAEDSKLRARHNDEGEYVGEDDERREVAPQEQSDEEDDFETFRGHEDAINSDDVDEEVSKQNARLAALRTQAVMQSARLVDAYEFDVKREQWCTVSFKLPLLKSKLDVLGIVEAEAAKFVVHSVPGIEKAIVKEDRSLGKVLQTQGINLQAFYQHGDKLAVDRLHCNDVHVVLNTYGVEAAMRAIVKEMTLVFSSYGIHVDPRHLLLIADYMCQSGHFKAFNRLYMETSASPLQKMSFETTMNFLKESMLLGWKDELKSPSARLVLGQVTGGGSGLFDLVTKLG